MEPHAYVGVVAAEDPGVVVLALLERHDGRIEDGIGRGEQVARDDGVGRAAPHDFARAAGRSSHGISGSGFPMILRLFIVLFGF